MLREIYIKNYTIVSQLRLTLHPGLSTLTGETGAGKSIIVDSVSLALGARADSNAIRHGEKQCDITLCFDLTSIPNAQTWLQANHYADDEESECFITRTISRDGRSRASINGKPCPLSVVRTLAKQLLIIHGQHESQHYLAQEQQQRYVDQFGKHEAHLQELATLYFQWRENETQLAELNAQADSRLDQINLLTYQLDELHTLNPQENEWQQLHQEHHTLHQANSLITGLSNALDLTIENERANARDLLYQAIEQVKAINLPEKQLDSATELLNTAMINLQEATDELTQYRDTLDLSADRLAYLEKRLTQLHDLARKHHVAPEELPHVAKSIAQKLKRLTSFEEHLEQLTQKQTTLEQHFQKIAATLSQHRVKAAKVISQKITDFMQQLGMQGGEFHISLEKNNQRISATGAEKLLFLVKTNPGQALQPLAKVVSGGELSRISLALQAIIAEKENTPTFIFDEVDTGIGGKTAEIVGSLLHDLGQRAQVFCITHLPQVAAQGDHHYLVSKSSTANSTTAQVNPLSKQERIEEIARMLSGSKVSTQTLLHAEELIFG